MNGSVWIAMAFAAAASLALGSAGQEGQTITVTGCLQNFSAKGTVGTTERGYLLTNVATDRADDAKRPASSPAAEPAAGGIPAGTSGTAGTVAPTSGSSAGSAPSDKTPTPAAKANQSYLLEGEDKELKDHVGHKIEVTGTLQSRPDEAAKTDEAHLQVASIRMLASNCSMRPK
jgi:hypothetical protein